MDVLLFNGGGEPPFNEGPIQAFQSTNALVYNNWLQVDLYPKQQQISNLNFISEGLGPMMWHMELVQ